MRLTLLDAIRGILAVIVLLYHWGLDKLVNKIVPTLGGGEWGMAVDYFFILSGFVLCLSLSRKQVGIIKFIIIRGFRLIPVAAASLALQLITIKFLNPIRSLPTISEILSNLSLVQSLFLVKSYPGSMWSASFEMWLPAAFCFFSNAKTKKKCAY